MPEIEDLSGRKLGEFVLRARIGAGGFGAVYRCEQPLLGREAVVKVLHPRLRHNGVVLQRFLREAQLASQLDHPGAAHIYAFGIERDDGLFWIAMEMVQGVGLNRWLHEHGPMPLERFVPFFEQLAEVVHAAHERGIVHRDLKPSNVMVIERAGRLTPKLLDFGVAKLVDGAKALCAAQAIPGDPGEQAAATRAAGSNRMSGSEETVSQTASTPYASGRDLRRLTDEESKVGSPPYMSPEQWTNAAAVGPSSDLYSLGVLGYEAITGRRPFHAANSAEYAELHCDAPVPPVGEGLPPALDRFFERALAKHLEQRWKTALQLAAALRAEWIATRVGSAALPGGETSEAGVGGDDEVAPYLGLAPYVAGDAERFVGREAEVAAFLERLRTRPLHVVVGPPGTGKSSFVHAGVIPGLPPGWRAVSLRPGAAPLAALAFRLETAGVTGDDLRTLLATLPAEAAARVADAAGTGAIVVVIDQLEELFTLGVSAEERERFVAAVAQLAASADLPIRVIVTIRDDYLMQLDALPALRPLLSSALILLGNPLHDDLVRIVVEPARCAGYTLSDPELAHDMVRAVTSRPGALALLSFTALRLWELRDRTLRQLTRSAYDAMDGIAGALVRHAETTFDALSSDEQRLTREIFRQLVTADGARAPLSAQELHQRLAALRSGAVLDKLIAARLIATSEAEPDAAGARQTQVEVIHDALLEAWPRLQRWIREDVDGARMRDQLRIAARQWSDRGRPRGQLWRDDALVDLRRWLRQPKAAQLSELEAAFVESSLRIARRARLRGAIALVAAGVAVVLPVFMYSWMHSALARRAAEQRLTQVYVDRGMDTLLEGKHTEALVYLAQAVHRGADSPGMKFMFARAVQSRMAELGRLSSASGRMWWATFSPDDQRIVTTDERGAQIWDAKTRRPVVSLPHGSRVYQAAYARGGRLLLTAGGDGYVKVWDAATGEPGRALTRRQPPGEITRYVSLVVDPRGDGVAAIDESGRIVDVWSLATGQLLAELVNDRNAMNLPSLAFSHDGCWLATSAGDDVQVYDTATWKLAVTLAGREISTLSFDPTGPQLAIASWRGDVSIWMIPGGGRVQHLHEAADKLTHLVFSPDGAYLAVGGQDGIDRVLDVHTGELQLELKNHHGAVRWVEFDPASRLLVSTGSDGVVVVSDVVRRMKLTSFEGPRAPVRVAHFDATSQKLISASWDGTARLLNAASRYLQWDTATVGEDCGEAVSAAVDRRFIAINCKDHGTQIWDAAYGRLLAELPSPTPVAGVILPSAMAVSSAGDRAAVAVGNSVAVYALPGGHLVRTIRHPDAVTTLAFARLGHDLISAGRDGSLLITRDGSDPVGLAALHTVIHVVGFVPDHRAIAVDENRQLHVFDVERLTELASIHLPALAGAFRASSDGRRLLTIPPNGPAFPLVLCDLEQFRIVAPLDSGKGQVLAARFVRDDREILTAGTDGAARIWNAATGRLQQAYFGSSQFLLDAALDPTGTMVVTAGGDGVLRFWDVASSRMIWTLQAHRSQINGIHFEDDDIVTRGFTGELARWSLPRLPASQEFAHFVARVARCLPLRLDDESGQLVEQDQSCDM